LADGENGAGQYGDLTVNPDGSYSFELNAAAQSLDDNETATETFTFQVSDGTETTTQTITVNIAGSNDGPIEPQILVGTAGDDVLTGADGDDELYGGAGDDTLEGGAGNDLLVGDAYSSAAAPMYLMEEGADSILKILPDGTVTTVVTQDEIRAVTGNSDADMDDRGIGVDPTGNLFFTESDSDSVLMKPADGGPLQVIASRADIQAATDSDWADPKALAVGSDGIVYVSDDTSDSIVRIDPATGVTTVLVDEQTLDDLPGISTVDLDGGLVISPDGMIYAASDGSPDAIFAINTVTGEASVLASNTPFTDLDVYMVLAPNGDLIVADDGTDTIYRVDPATGAVSVFLSEQQLEGVTGLSVDLEGGIGFDSEGNFYVAEENTDSILRWTVADANEGTIDTGSGTTFLTSNELGRYTDLEGGMTFGATEAAGNDILVGGDGNDTMMGGAGNDELNGGNDNDVLYGGTGNDLLIGGAGTDYAHGGAGADTLDGGSGADTLVGGSGIDTITGGSGDDTIDGGEDADTIHGGSGDDLIDGGSGDDLIYGGTGDDTIDGGSGDDIIIGGDGADILDGGSGENIFMYNAASEGGDTIIGFDSDKDMFQFDDEAFGDFSNATVETNDAGFKIIGEDGAEIGFDEGSNTLFHRAGENEGYQTIATVNGDDVMADDIEII
jgi:VCBS repeat-containing protein